MTGVSLVHHPPEVLDELRKNQEAYQEVKAQMEREHWGKTVLLHSGEVVNVYNNKSDAYSIACEKYGLGKFSLQQVGALPIDLGIHALSLNPQ